ncbi:MAG TPA: helix-turn-helix domain-containing protein [Alkalispirochaeta sp.]|nr:helix-turn-helix domain-containing protein [Alkalispirochaeta sp.]
MGHAADAIEAFERVTGLRVTVHDLQHRLWDELPESRFRHAHPVCVEVKLGTEGHRCIHFEVERFRAAHERWPDGRVHRCHAGVVEVGAPVREDGRLIYVLFAGPMSHLKDTVLDLDEHRPSYAPHERHNDPDIPATGDRVRTVRLLLLQLGARLCSLNPPQDAVVGQDHGSRAASIRHYLGAYYSQQISLKDVARHLHLSPDRTRHVVQEEFGLTFRGLLQTHRLDAARALLLNSRLSVGEIAMRCGFGSHSSFTRLFTDTYGSSPHGWRRRHQG